MNIVVQDAPAKRRDDGLSSLSLSLPEQGRHSRVDIGIDDLARLCPKLGPLALDFLLIASACYTADKLVERSATFDCWTRHFEMLIPVSDPDAWSAVAEPLAEALGFLSSDQWEFTFSRLNASLYRSPRRRRRRTLDMFGRPDAVCLFSGGLDSLTGAIDLLEMPAKPRVLLVGHYDAPTGEQVDLFGPIRQYYRHRVRQVRTRIRLDPVAGDEATLRSRSLVFLALGICAAQAHGPDIPLYAYENGHIALNIPLTPSRAGACSTRTMHPYFLDRIVSVLNAVGIANPVVRPYELKTKGECVIECRNPGLLRSMVDLSVSCSHASRRQNWIRLEARNCGYCVPCMIRRGALHKAGIDAGEAYGFDVCAGELLPDYEGESANDLRAMLDFLRQDKNVDTLASEIQRVATVSDLAQRATMLGRGFSEIRALIKDKGVPRIRIAAGL